MSTYWSLYPCLVSLKYGPCYLCTLPFSFIFLPLNLFIFIYYIMGFTIPKWTPSTMNDHEWDIGPTSSTKYPCGTPSFSMGLEDTIPHIFSSMHATCIPLIFDSGVQREINGPRRLWRLKCMEVNNTSYHKHFGGFSQFSQLRFKPLMPLMLSGLTTSSIVEPQSTSSLEP